MSGVTTDRTDPGLRELQANGQQKTYLVLSEEERARGFVRPVRSKYIHLACGCETSMGLSIAETYARNPKFYSGTFCVACGRHFNLGPPWDPAFVWLDGEPVGSTAEEAAAYLAEQHTADARKDVGGGI